MNVAAARLARKAVGAHRGETGRDAFVAGALGPTNRTLSLAVDVNDPGKRTHAFTEVAAAYRDQIRGLIDGGADVLLFETVFDTLVLKAALFAAQQLFDEGARRVPLMVSVTITDRSGRTLSGQLVEAFWNSVSHAPLLSVGINCALGAKEMRPYVEELSGLAPVFTSAYPNAGLPNAFGGFDETPEIMCADLAAFARAGWVNVVGGCCGTTPEHIRAIADAVRERPAPARPRDPARDPARRPRALHAPRRRLHGRRRADERDGLPEVREARPRGGLRGRARRRPAAGRRRGERPRRLHGRGDARRSGRDDAFPEPRVGRAGHREAPDHARQLEVGRDRGGPEVPAGQARRELAQPQGGRGRVPREGPARAALRRRRDRDGVRRGRPGDDRGSEGRDRGPRVPDPRGGGRLPARGRDLRPERPHGRDGHRGARRLRARLLRGDTPHQGNASFREGLGRNLERVVLVPRQRRGPRGDARRLPLPRDPRGPRHGHRERGPARRLRGRPEGPPRKGRGRAPEPAKGRDGTSRRVCRVRPAGGSGRGEGRRVAGRNGRGAPLARPRSRDHGLRRGGHRGGAAERSAVRWTSSRARSWRA